jgi:phosphoserine phosphatase SerB
MSIITVFGEPGTLPHRKLSTRVYEVHSSVLSIGLGIGGTTTTDTTDTTTSTDNTSNEKTTTTTDNATLLEQMKRKGIQDPMCIQKDNIFRTRKRMFVFDMDSTLIDQEVIDELAREAGVYDVVSSITERAMRGELDFNQSLIERCKTLQGQPVSILERVKSRITLTRGALECCRALKRLGCVLVVLSGGFLPLAQHIQSLLGLDYAFANELQVEEGVLTGKVHTPIVNAERKRDLLLVIAQQHRIPLDQVCAVGDGANDLLMMKASGLGVAFCAKPRVQEQASVAIQERSLLHILYLLGLDDTQIHDLLT